MRRIVVSYLITLLVPLLFDVSRGLLVSPPPIIDVGIIHRTTKRKSSIYSSPTNTNNEGEENQPYLLFPGGGLFFYWQAGVVEYMRKQKYDLTQVRFGGASAGALTATLAAADVDFYKATELALAMSDEAGIWDRKEGLQGIWGPIIKTWLEELLPDDVLQKQIDEDNRLSLLVFDIPSFKRTRISTFESKDDLIECCMASVHIPWFLDGRLWTTDFRKSPSIDGSFWSSVEDFDNVNDSNYVYPDYTKDPVIMENRAFFDFITTLGPQSVYELLQKGEEYGKVMDERGDFDCFPKKK